MKTITLPGFVNLRYVLLVVISFFLLYLAISQFANIRFASVGWHEFVSVGWVN